MALDQDLFNLFGRHKKRHFSNYNKRDAYFWKNVGRNGCFNLSTLRNGNPNEVVEIWDNSGCIARLPRQQAVLKFM